jgi:hypothetical protein
MSARTVAGTALGFTLVIAGCISGGAGSAARSPHDRSGVDCFLDGAMLPPRDAARAFDEPLSVGTACCSGRSSYENGAIVCCSDEAASVHACDRTLR